MHYGGVQHDNVDTFYKRFQTDPSQDNLSEVVHALKPTIDYTVQSIGAGGDPYVKTMALTTAAEAIKKYDPAREGASSLPTFISSELRQLTRTARKSRSVLQLPERTQLDAMALHRARKKFEDENGREPDVGELADSSGFSIKRIEKVMTQTRAVPSEAALPGQEGSENDPDFNIEAVDYIYHDSDHIDRKILEHKTGFGGAELLDPQMLGPKLGLTPSQLSRRSARLAMKINEMEEALKSL